MKANAVPGIGPSRDPGRDGVGLNSAERGERGGAECPAEERGGRKRCRR